MQETVRKNSAKAWLLATRPKTLSGALVPVMLASCLALRDLQDDFSWLLCVLCLAFAGLMQIAANLINDLMDFLKGSDREDRLGPERACQMGWISPSRMKMGIFLVLSLAALSGILMLLLSYQRMPWHGSELVLTGLLCFVFAFLYTTHFSYLGLGDILVVVFFGLVPIVMSYYLQSATVTWGSVILGFLCGIMTDTLLIVNNVRDINEDRKSGKKTIIVRMGLKNGQRLYLWCGILAMTFLLPLCLIEDISPMAGCAVAAIYLIPHCLTYRRMVAIDHGRELNSILQRNSQNMLLLGLVLSITLILF